ncbi:MAG: hypothetical protein RLY93_05055 [Sumerlaeia bacterium]
MNIQQFFDIPPIQCFIPSGAHRAFGEWDEAAALPGGPPLTYLRARHLDTESGTLLSRDIVEGVIGVPWGTAPYQYARANPVAFADPRGTYSGNVWEPINNFHTQQLRRGSGDVYFKPYVVLNASSYATYSPSPTYQALEQTWTFDPGVRAWLGARRDGTIIGGLVDEGYKTPNAGLGNHLFISFDSANRHAPGSLARGAEVAWQFARVMESHFFEAEPGSLGGAVLSTRSPFAGAFDPAMLAAGAIRVVAARGESWGLMGGGPVGMTVRAGVAGPTANSMVAFQAVNPEASHAPQRLAERELNQANALGEGGGEVVLAEYFGGFRHDEHLKQLKEKLREQAWHQSKWEQASAAVAAALGQATIAFPPAAVVTVPVLATIGAFWTVANAGDAIGYLSEGELGAAGAESFQAALWSLELLPGVGALKTAGRAGVASVRASARTGAAEGATLARVTNPWLSWDR